MCFKVRLDIERNFFCICPKAYAPIDKTVTLSSPNVCNSPATAARAGQTLPKMIQYPQSDQKGNKKPLNQSDTTQTSQNILTPHGIQLYLTTKADKFCIEVYDTVTSTNTMLKERAANEADCAGCTQSPDGTVIIARHQTAGRGRMGRNFYSPADTGIYMSILLRPNRRAEDALFLTTATAVGVAKAIENVTGKETAIKWVNDIFCDGKKVCGILTEGETDPETGKLKYAVVGIGVNLLPPREGFPEELNRIATSILRQDTDAEMQNKLAAEILNQLAVYLYAPEQQHFLAEYRERCFLIGRNVTILPGHEQAMVLGIDDKVGLCVQLQDGTQKTLRTGEVSVRMTEKDGSV